MQTYTEEESKHEASESTEKEAEERKAAVMKWKGRIEDATNQSKNWWTQTQQSWDEYLAHAYGRPTGAEIANQGISQDRSNYAVWWSSIRTVQPALYSRTPDPVVEKVFDDMTDNVARLSSLCLERLSKYNMRCNPYDRVMYATRDMFLHSGRTTVRAVFEASFNKKLEQKRYQQVQSMGADGQPTMMVLDDQGQPFADINSLMQDEEGYYSEEEVEDVDNYGVKLQPVHFKDLLVDPSARIWEEVNWIAFKAMMTEREVEQRFGEEIASKLSYNETMKDKDDDVSSDREQKIVPEKYAKVWEIWNKRNETVYWYCDEYVDGFLDEKEDPYELLGFFPCPPFMLGTVGPDSMIPVPDYIQLRPLINQLNGMFNRLRLVIRAMRRRGVFDASIPELQDLANFASEAEFIGVKNWKELVGERGLENIVSFFPTVEFASAAQQLSAAIQEFENKFYELYGIPDILRGASDPRETAAAQQLKGQFLSLRFSATQREFQRLNRDVIEIMDDLALQKYPDDKLGQIMGFQFMKPEDQQLFPQVLALLKNDTDRMMRINIETDSTITMNQNAEIEQRNYLADTLFKGLQTLNGMSQENPAFMPLVAQVVLYTVRGLRNGQEIEQTLEKTLAQLEQQAQQPQQPPPPDPGVQKAQIQAQVQTQKMQLDSQLAQAKLMMQQQDLQIKAQALQVQLQKIQAQTQNEQMKLQLDREISQLDAFMQASKLDMEKQYLGLDMEERYMTEQRLQRETDLQEVQVMQSASEPAKQNGSGKAPDVNIVNVTPGGLF